MQLLPERQGMKTVCLRSFRDDVHANGLQMISGFLFARTMAATGMGGARRFVTRASQAADPFLTLAQQPFLLVPKEYQSIMLPLADAANGIAFCCCYRSYERLYGY